MATNTDACTVHSSDSVCSALCTVHMQSFMQLGERLLRGNTLYDAWTVGECSGSYSCMS